MGPPRTPTASPMDTPCMYKLNNFFEYWSLYIYFLFQVKSLPSKTLSSEFANATVSWSFSLISVYFPKQENTLQKWGFSINFLKTEATAGSRWVLFKSFSNILKWSMQYSTSNMLSSVPRSIYCKRRTLYEFEMDAFRYIVNVSLSCSILGCALMYIIS